MNNQIYLRFAVLELSKLSLYGTCYIKLHSYFGQENQQLHHLDFDSFVLIIGTQSIINDLKIIELLFVFSNLNENHELVSNKGKKAVGKFKIETLQCIWINEIFVLRSKAYSF